MSKKDSINLRIFAALKVSELSQVPLFLLSNPGIGKTTTVRLFAKVRGYEVVAVHGNRMTPEAILGYDCAPNDVDKFDSARHLKPTWFKRILENKKNGKKSLLFLDELTTCNEFVQSTLLSLVFDREIDQDRLPDDTLVVAAGNYANNLSNTATILPPMLNRFMLYNIKIQPTDLDVFFNKYKGGALGKREDYFETLLKQMEEIDKQERHFSEEKMLKIGDTIESTFLLTTKMLMTSNERPVDLSVTELQTIYSDVDGDNDLPNFISPRSAVYARDITIATYKAFGPAGIQSENYRNMMFGLIGIGLKRSNNGDVLKSKISDEFCSAMERAVTDLEKLNNDDIPKYEEFFSATINEHRTEDGKFAKVMDIPTINALTNKISEMIGDKKLQGIERPLDKEYVKSICNLLKISSETIKNYKINPITNNDESKKSIEKISSDIVYWNNLVELMSNITRLVKSSEFNYDQDAKTIIKNTQSDLRTSSYRIKSIRKTRVTTDPALGNMLPELKSFVKLD